MRIENIIELVRNKNGIEVGGPSSIFRTDGCLPIYPYVNMLDGCNFSSKTIWEPLITEGKNYSFYNGKVGFQFICEATELFLRVGSRYDFLLCSNCLEHIANPLRAMIEFAKVLNVNGIMILVLPKKEVTFDHNRSITDFDHIVKDYVDNVDEGDLTHLEEILSLHDLSMDPLAGTFEQFKSRSLKNKENRALHQHVFDGDLLSKMFGYLGIEQVDIIDTSLEYIAVGRRP